MCLEAMCGTKHWFNLMNSSYTKNTQGCSASIYVFKHSGDTHPKAHSTDKQKTLFTGSFHSESFMSCEFSLKAPISMNKLIKANVWNAFHLTNRHDSKFWNSHCSHLKPYPMVTVNMVWWRVLHWSYKIFGLLWSDS
jgi:hypothetical protein